MWGLIILRVVQRLVTFGAFNVFVYLANLIDFLPFLSFAFKINCNFKVKQLRRIVSMAQFKWGINNDYAPLKHVLLGKPEYYKWVDAGPLIGRTLLNAHKTGIKFDLQTAMSQHAEMVAIYEENGVECHY